MSVRSAKPQFDRAKLEEAVWLIVDHCPPEELGNVKLHKVLYFADMFSFVMNGHAVTGDEYLKQRFGPTARHLTAALRSLEQAGLVSIEQRDFFGFMKKTFRSTRPYSRSRLSEAETSLIREVADIVRGHTAKSISDLSHNAVWEAAAMGEVLPYFTALRLMPQEAEEADVLWAQSTAREHASSRSF